MQFHEYVTLRETVAKHGSTPEIRDAARRMNREESRIFAIEDYRRECSLDPGQTKDSPKFRRADTAVSEHVWVPGGLGVGGLGVRP